MANMSYCRFENTYSDFIDCAKALEDIVNYGDSISESEWEFAKKLAAKLFVELGKMENVLNLEFGKTLAKHADIVIVIGKHNAEMLINGLKDGGMSTDNIKFAKTLNKGNDLLNEIMIEGDVVLFENDLPDNYT